MTGLLIRWSISGFLTKSKPNEPPTFITDFATTAKKAIADEKQPRDTVSNRAKPR